MESVWRFCVEHWYVVGPLAALAAIVLTADVLSQRVVGRFTEILLKAGDAIRLEEELLSRYYDNYPRWRRWFGLGLARFIATRMRRLQIWEEDGQEYVQFWPDDVNSEEEFFVWRRSHKTSTGGSAAS